MDALTLLIADHNRVRGLFSRYRDAHDADDTATAARLASLIFTELEVHTAIEEEIAYPWMKGDASSIDETVDEGLQEHHVVKILMEEIGTLEPSTDEWAAKMTVLMENVEHHADEEESDLFPEVRGRTTADEREDIGRRLDARKGELGAPVLADTLDLTTTQLRELATEQQIPGRSKMDHDELAATVAPS